MGIASTDTIIQKSNSQTNVTTYAVGSVTPSCRTTRAGRRDSSALMRSTMRSAIYASEVPPQTHEYVRSELWADGWSDLRPLLPLRREGVSRSQALRSRCRRHLLGSAPRPRGRSRQRGLDHRDLESDPGLPEGPRGYSHAASRPARRRPRRSPRSWPPARRRRATAHGPRSRLYARSAVSEQSQCRRAARGSVVLPLSFLQKP